MSQQNQGPTSGSFTDARAATEALRRASEYCNLVSPATSVSEIPPGCAILISQVLVDLTWGEIKDRYGKTAKDKDGVPKMGYTSGDVYPVDGGKLALSKAPMYRIGAALGISWVDSYRIDDCRAPHWCRWLVVGQYKSFDMQPVWVRGNKQEDLREGSSRIRGKSPEQTEKMRETIQERAESGAKLRAIADILPRSYTLEQIKKPFVVARLMFNGRTEDPRLKMMFAEKIADAYLGAGTALYGAAGHQQLPQLPRQNTPRLLSAPPVGSASDDSGEWDVETGEVRDTHGESTHAQRAEAPPANPARQGEAKPAERAGSAAAKPQQGGARSGLVMPFGRSKDLAIEDAPQRDLEWMANNIGEKLYHGESRYPEKDEPFHKALLNEIARRESASRGAERQDFGGKL